MADATLTRALKGAEGVLYIYGTALTKTTTSLYIDGVQQQFEWASDTEIIFDGVPDAGMSIEVEKNGVRSNVIMYPGGDTGGGATDPNNPDNTSTTEDGNDELADLPAESTPGAEPTPPEQMTPEVQPERVETIQEQGIGPRDPYPTGNPQGNPLSGYNAARGLSDEPNPTAGDPELPNAEPA